MTTKTRRNNGQYQNDCPPTHNNGYSYSYGYGRYWHSTSASANHPRNITMIMVIMIAVCNGVAGVAADECYTKTDGSDYAGTIAVTQSGRTCQPWSSQTPHAHAVSDAITMEELGLVSNYCRNTDGSTTVWCYTMDASTIRESCTLPPLSRSCDPPYCNPSTTCYGNGNCNNDGTCDCKPYYYGTYCRRYQTEVGSVTDGGLAGIIVGWLLFPLIVIAIACCMYHRD